MNVTLRPAMTREQFLDWSGHQDGRWEFDGTRPLAMTGGSHRHGIIVARLIHALLKRLDGMAWMVLADTGMATVGDKVRYPDALVTRTPAPGSAKLVPGVVVVFEVLSPSSVRTDRVDKVREYAAITSIRRYIIGEQDAPVLTVLHRAEASAGWDTLPLAAGETLDLPELGIALPVDEIYAGLAFPGDDAPAAA
jgi:Uma2 family endonuclease